MRTILRLESVMEQNQDRRNFDLIFHEQFGRLQPQNIKREGRTRTFPNTYENDWTVSGEVGIGTSTPNGHRRLPLLRQLGGSNNVGMSHKNNKNGKDSKNG